MVALRSTPTAVHSIVPPPGLAPPPGLEQCPTSPLAEETDLTSLVLRNAQLKEELVALRATVLEQHGAATANTWPLFGAANTSVYSPAMSSPWLGNVFAFDAVAADVNSSCLWRSRAGTESTVSGASVPSSDDEVDLTESHEGDTTLIIKEIPAEVSRDMLMNLIDIQGFTGCYDFVYMPHNFKQGNSFGYAFINFTSTAIAELFLGVFQGFADWSTVSNKIAEVSWTETHQGLDAHIERYRNSPTMHESIPDGFKAAMFKDGKRVPFPPPTKTLKPPRALRR